MVHVQLRLPARFQTETVWRYNALFQMLFAAVYGLVGKLDIMLFVYFFCEEFREFLVFRWFLTFGDGIVDVRVDGCDYLYVFHSRYLFNQ